MSKRTRSKVYKVVFICGLTWYILEFSSWIISLKPRREKFEKSLVGSVKKTHDGILQKNKNDILMKLIEQDDFQTMLTAEPVIPLIYVITPTFWRLEQKAEMTRTANALRGTPRLHWIVIEDSVNRTELVTHFLRNCGINYTHLFTRTPKEINYKRLFHTIYSVNRGVFQRNAGLEWITKYAEYPSVLYFADDDNTYDPQIFQEIRYTQRVSVFPVGLVGGSLYEAPVVKNGKVIGWINSFPRREFPVYMAGFAVNTEFYINAEKPKFQLVTNKATIENAFLIDLGTTQEDLEPKADQCTKILVWQTKTLETILWEKTAFYGPIRRHGQSLLEV